MVKPIILEPSLFLRNHRLITISTMLSLFLGSLAILLLVTYYLKTSLYAVLVYSIVVAFVLCFSLYVVTILYKALNEYRLYREIVKRVTIGSDSLTINGASSISIGRLLLYRYRIGGIVSSGYRFERIARAKTNTIGYKHMVSKQVFLALLTRYRGRLHTIEYMYRGLALEADFNGYKLYIIPLYPFKPLFSRNTLEVKKNGDYGSIEIGFKDKKLSTRIVYKREHSRRLVVRMRHRFRHMELFSELFSISDSGEHTIEYDFPLIDDIYILLLPGSKRLLEYTVLDLTGFPTLDCRGGLEGVIVGYRGTELELALDIPLGIDVVDKIRLDTLVETEKVT